MAVFYVRWTFKITIVKDSFLHFIVKNQNQKTAEKGDDI